MSFTEVKRREIKKYLLRKIDEDDKELVYKVADAFGISTTSVKRYIDAEITAGHIVHNSNVKCGYTLCFYEKKLEYDIEKLSDREDTIIFDDLFPFMQVNDKASHIWSYTLPEIFNNSLEHSKGKKINAIIRKCCLYTVIVIADDGIGVFNNVRLAMEKFGFKNPTNEDALAELYKGKFTSFPERHSGEGIFFSMRMMDKFLLWSDGIVLKGGYSENTSMIKSHLLAYASRLMGKGTMVVMCLENETLRESREIFDKYSDVDEGFYKTYIPIRDICFEKDPVARSQARRICLRLESFKEVIFDFMNVDFMGQGFADEIFRVFHNAHPEVTLTPVNMNAEVQKMYLYTINNKVTTPKYD